MKKIVLSIFWVMVGLVTVAQENQPKPKKTREDYLKISKSQRTTGWILLGIGVTCFAIAAPGNVDFDTLGTLVVVGGIATIVSIPLFLAAGKNKRRARAMPVSLDFNMERRMGPPAFALQGNAHPSVGIKLNL